MKNPIAIIFNDAHLKVGNENEVIHSIEHMLKFATENKITDLIFAGDLFDSRSFQRQSVLQAFDHILLLIEQAKCNLYIFPGNHDKTSYASYDSFLDIYRHYPNVHFNRTMKNIVLGSVSIDLLPFFSDDMLIPMLEESKGADILISHFEMEGSTHLGQMSEKSTINKKLLSKWDKVYLGHYHNHHEITKNIVHLPSLRQDNFGEDNNKGFSVLYDDLSYEIQKGSFKEFIKVTINADDITTKKIKDLINEYKNSENSIRFEFYGQESKIKSIDKKLFKGTGIDFKAKYDKKDSLDPDDTKQPNVIEHYNKEEVEKSFRDFCSDKGLDYKEGKKLLDEFFKAKENE